MSEDAERNLLMGWCRQGDTFSDSVSRRDPAVYKRIEADACEREDKSEARASFYLYTFTGLVPQVEDDQSGRGRGRNRAVDLSLAGGDGHREVAEVTSSLDATYQGASDALAKFEGKIVELYHGATSWALDLEWGWESARLVKEVALEVAARLNDLDSGVPVQGGPYAVHPLVKAWPLVLNAPPSVHVYSRGAGVSSIEGPYLDALSAYLATSCVIQKKVLKLDGEASKFDATRQHLFILMASTGAWGGLLPVSPSYFTWGAFEAPSSLTDLWLEGGTGELYHWTRESGWVFHDLTK